MKEVTLKDGKVVKTPWLRPEEAAVYCGISRSLFHERGHDLPHGGGRQVRLYHIKILDAWVKGELEIPFYQEKEARHRPRRIRRSEPSLSLIDPGTGRIYESRGTRS